MSELLEQTQLLEQPLALETEQLRFIDRTRNMAHTAIESVRGRSREVIVAACGAAALTGGGVAEASQTDSAARAQRESIEQRYNAYLAQFPSAPVKKPFSEYFSQSVVYSTCSENSMYGNATYRLVPGSNNKIEVSLERKYTSYSEKALIASDVDGNLMTVNDMDWRSYSVSCSDVVRNKTSIGLFLYKKNASKFLASGWKRVSGVVEQPLPDRSINTVKDTTTDDKNVNPDVKTTDKVVIKLKKPLSKKDIASGTLFPAVETKMESLVSQLQTTRVTMLGPIQRKTRTVNAGTKWFGKGGAFTDIKLK